MKHAVSVLREWVHDSKQIVFFGGAGVSTESNIPDFRSETGIYSEKQYSFPPETILSHTFFIEHTKEFFEFYFDRMIYENARPNPAHFALSELEKKGKMLAVVTQNIDGLHQMAGSKTVLELHGSVHSNHCLQCAGTFSLQEMLAQKGQTPVCPHCGGVIKPDVVLYEEPLDDTVMSRAIDCIAHADLLIVGGTSLNVYPAAGLIRYQLSGRMALINRSATPYDEQADLVIHENIGSVLSHACETR